MSIADKTLADVMESLIGAFFLAANDLAASLHFMNWAGIMVPANLIMGPVIAALKRRSTLSDLPAGHLFGAEQVDGAALKRRSTLFSHCLHGLISLVPIRSATPGP